jgi:prophage tail gpP-like protein
MSFEEVQIEAAGRLYTGWEGFSVTAGVNQVTRSFQVSATEIPTIGDDPRANPEFNFPPGTRVQIYATGTLLCAGYVFDYEPSFGPDGHVVRLSGRGNGSVFVDSSVDHEKGYWEDKTDYQILQDMDRFGVGIGINGSPSAPIPYFQHRKGSTPFREWLRFKQEGTLSGQADGSIKLIKRDATEITHTGGLEQGRNIIRASARLSSNEKFSDYLVLGQSADGSNSADHLQPHARVVDPLVGRYAVKTIVAPAALDNASAKRRAREELLRSYGFDTTASITVPGFRDAAGKVWEPGWSVYVDSPYLHLDAMMYIQSVEHLQTDQNGTTTTLTLVNPGAYLSDGRRFVKTGSQSMWFTPREDDEGNIDSTNPVGTSPEKKPPS